MRRHPSIWTVAALLAVALPSFATPAVTISGEVEAGGRSVSGDPKSARFEQYRDVNEGVFGGGHVRIEDRDGRYFVRFGGNDFGERDGEYFLEGGRWGHWGVSGQVSLIPHHFSVAAVTPYSNVNNAMLQLPFVRPPADLDAAVSGAALDAKLDFRTLQGDVDLFYKPVESVKLSAGYRVLDRKGRRPEQMFFGFSNFVHFPQPVDEKVHEGTAGVQFVHDDLSLGLNYTASFFTNEFDSVAIDNPLIGAPVVGDSDVARVALAPDNSSHLVSLSGAATVPAPFLVRVAGTVSWGIRLQDEDFVPMTANAALFGDPRLVLPESSLDGRIQTILGNFVATARPAKDVRVQARYRIYDYDNQTDAIQFTAAVPSDESIQDRNMRSLTGSYRKQNASLETSYRVTPRTTVAIGFDWEHWNRSREREVRKLDEYSPELRVDHRAGDWGRFRTSYTFTAREGSGYDELAPFRIKEGAAAPTSLTPPIRKYDQADNRQHGLHFLANLYPCEGTDVTLTANFHLTEYTEGDFGLLDDDRFDVGIDLSHAIHERVELSLFYTYDWVDLRQRTASSGGTAAWTGRHEDRAHTGGAELAVALLPDRLTWTTGYLIQEGVGRTHASGVPASNAVDFPTIRDTLVAFNSELRFFYSKALTFSVGYRLEDYEQKDYQFDGLGVTSASSTVEGVPVSGANDVFLRNGLRDYRAHIVSLGAIFRF